MSSASTTGAAVGGAEQLAETHRHLDALDRTVVSYQRAPDGEDAADPATVHGAGPVR